MHNFARAFILLAAVALVDGQPKPEPDTIVFPNGDRLTGQLVEATSSKITFKNEALGELVIEWSKIKELRTSGKVAVIRKGVKIGRHEVPKDIPQGTLAADAQTLQLTPAQSIPVKEATAVVPEADFNNAITRRPGILKDWKGAITAGATIVQATQDDRTFNIGIGLIRTEPTETWINPRNRTEIDYSQSYGELSQPNTPSVKTSIYHAGAQRDEYFSPSLFGFGQASFDHNFSQGLDLQQTYNGGIGWTAISTSKQILNLKGSMSYVKQQFTTGPSENLIGSVFEEDYARKLPRGVGLLEKASVTPGWNNTNAYSAAFSALLTMPVYKRLSGSTGVIDNFLNNPPPGFKKNSFQYTLGLTYTLQ